MGRNEEGRMKKERKGMREREDVQKGVERNLREKREREYEKKKEILEQRENDVCGGKKDELKKSKKGRGERR